MSEIHLQRRAAENQRYLARWFPATATSIITAVRSFFFSPRRSRVLLLLLLLLFVMTKTQRRFIYGRRSVYTISRRHMLRVRVSCPAYSSAPLGTVPIVDDCTLKKVLCKRKFVHGVFSPPPAVDGNGIEPITYLRKYRSRIYGTDKKSGHTP